MNSIIEMMIFLENVIYLQAGIPQEKGTRFLLLHKNLHPKS
jgi:hypothetical protein